MTIVKKLPLFARLASPFMQIAYKSAFLVRVSISLILHVCPCRSCLVHGYVYGINVRNVEAGAKHMAHGLYCIQLLVARVVEPDLRTLLHNPVLKLHIPLYL